MSHRKWIALALAASLWGCEGDTEAVEDFGEETEVGESVELEPATEVEAATAKEDPTLLAGEEEQAAEEAEPPADAVVTMTAEGSISQVTRRLERELRKHDMTVLSKTNYSRQLRARELPKMHLITFASAEDDVEHVKENPALALHLTHEVLAYEQDGQTYLAYTDVEQELNWSNLETDPEFASQRAQTVNEIVTAAATPEQQKMAAARQAGGQQRAAEGRPQQAGQAKQQAGTQAAQQGAATQQGQAAQPRPEQQATPTTGRTQGSAQQQGTPARQRGSDVPQGPGISETGEPNIETE